MFSYRFKVFFKILKTIKGTLKFFQEHFISVSGKSAYWISTILKSNPQLSELAFLFFLFFFGSTFLSEKKQIKSYLKVL